MDFVKQYPPFRIRSLGKRAIQGRAARKEENRATRTAGDRRAKLGNWAFGRKEIWERRGGGMLFDTNFLREASCKCRAEKKADGSQPGRGAGNVATNFVLGKRLTFRYYQRRGIL